METNETFLYRQHDKENNKIRIRINAFVCTGMYSVHIRLPFSYIKEWYKMATVVIDNNPIEWHFHWLPLDVSYNERAFFYNVREFSCDAIYKWFDSDHFLVL